MCAAYGMRWAWLRLTAAYGPMDDRAHLLPSVIQDLLAARRPAISAGTQEWDYLYVEDVAEAIRAVVVTPRRPRGVLNLSAGDAWTRARARRAGARPDRPGAPGRVRRAGRRRRVRARRRDAPARADGLGAAGRARRTGSGRRSTGSGSRAMSEQVLVSDYIATFLAARGVPAVFEMSGGMIARLLDSLYRLGETRVVSMHHEQSAAFAAGAAGAIDRRSGRRARDERPGRDEPPDRHRRLLLRLAAGRLHHRTGQPQRAQGRSADPPARLPGDRHRLDGRGRSRRPPGRCYSPEDVPERLAAAFALAVAGRPGPGAARHPDGRPGRRDRAALRRPSARAADAGRRRRRSTSCSTRSRAPSVRSSSPAEASARAVPFPCCARCSATSRCRSSSSLHGIDVLPYDHPLRVGMIGSYGNRWANRRDRPRRPAAGARQPARHPPDRRRHRVLQGRPHDLPRRLRAGRDQPPRRRAAAPSSATCARSSRPSPRARASRCSWPDWQDELDERARALARHGRAPRHRGHQPERAHARALRGLRAPPARSSRTSASTRCGPRSRSSSPRDQRFMTSGGMGAMGSGLPLAIGDRRSSTRARSS